MGKFVASAIGALLILTVLSELASDLPLALASATAAAYGAHYYRRHID